MSPLLLDIIRAAFALLFVLGLMWLMGYGMKRYGWKLGLPTPSGMGKTKRLQLLEILPLDTRNKIVLIRHDDQEHLLLIGMQNSHYIQSNKIFSSSVARGNDAL